MELESHVKNLSWRFYLPRWQRAGWSSGKLPAGYSSSSTWHKMSYFWLESSGSFWAWEKKLFEYTVKLIAFTASKRPVLSVWSLFSRTTFYKVCERWWINVLRWLGKGMTNVLRFKYSFWKPIANYGYTEHRNSPFDGPVKGGMENFLSNPGGFPSQQFPSNSGAMANGPQHMNGVSSQEDPSRQHPGFYQQPKQPLPSKVNVMAEVLWY